VLMVDFEGMDKSGSSDVWGLLVIGSRCFAYGYPQIAIWRKGIERYGIPGYGFIVDADLNAIANRLRAKGLATDLSE
jgi:hypothetical protein